VALSLRWGSVTAVRQRLDDLIHCEVDGMPCIAYPSLTGGVEEGDIVLVNTQARDLGLGSGGFDVLYANLTRGLGLKPAERAHVMALPYTPGQSAYRTIEEDGQLADSLDGMPVVCCGLHSQLAPAVAGIGPGRRIAYVQLAGGALPASLSDTVRALKSRQLLETAVAVAPCHDGDVQAITVAAALAWVKARGYDAAVCGIGPGIVGTNSTLGHGGMAVADAANAASALGGQAIVCVRYSGADERERHRGVSHHTRSALRLCVGEYTVAWPSGVEQPEWDEPITETDVVGWVDACEGLPLSHMGRGPSDDPWFFAAAFAAGRLARMTGGF
jgi:hypothetical protein